MERKRQTESERTTASEDMASRLKVVLGTMELGRRSLVTDKPCFEILNKFFSEGYTELDTARMYCGGKSEEILGRYMTETKLQECVVATKVNPFDGGNLSEASVKDQMSQCLSSLRTSCVGLLYLHAPDHTTPLEETLRACNQLHQEGKFRELGLSNYASWEVADACNICRRNGWVVPTVYQGMYNAVTRMVESELFPCLRHFGLRFYAYNPLSGGILTGKYKYSDLETQPEGRFFGTGAKWNSAYQERYWRQTSFQGVELVKRALEESYGTNQGSLVSAAFRWLNHHSLMKPEYGDAIIVGVSSLDHLASNLSACSEGPLDSRVVQAFDEAWKLDKANCARYFR